MRTAALAIAALVGASHLSSADQKRERPDYDGRGNPDSDADHWALWIPRVALSPLYVVNEYVLRRPLGALITTAEHHHWVNTVADILRFGPGDKNIILPTALFDFGLLPSVGLYYAGDDVIAPGNHIRLHAATWGPQWINLTGLERYRRADSNTELAARIEFKRQGDLLYMGTGPNVTTDTRARYGLQRFETGGTISHRLTGNSTGESKLSLTGGVRTISFREGGCCSDPTLDERIADGSLEMPPGYGVDYTAVFQRAVLVLDTRAARPASATGGYLQMNAETTFDVRNDRSWVEYGATFGLAKDLHRQRTIKLQTGVGYADPLHGDVVPFNELASLGGNLMPGFIAGWMVGRSTFATQAAYTWPCWMYLDGQARVGVGNAFGPHLDDLSADKLRLSMDIGMATSRTRDQGFEILFGVGTSTFDHGAGIDSVRFSFGSRKGF